MLEQVLIHQPEDPITFMINHLRLNNDSGEYSLQCVVAATTISTRDPTHPGRSQEALCS